MAKLFSPDESDRLDQRIHAVLQKQCLQGDALLQAVEWPRQELKPNERKAMKKILIVEDVEFNLDLLVQLLEDDYELVVARDGAAGVQLVASEKPDLILMDMSLPVLDGWQATRTIKADPNYRHIPVIGMSAHAMSGDQQKALDAGCSEYLTKPLDEALLAEKLNLFLGGKKP